MLMTIYRDDVNGDECELQVDVAAWHDGSITAETADEPVEEIELTKLEREEAREMLRKEYA